LDEQQKQEYLEDYQQEKEKGVKFYPDIIYKDLLVSFGIFLLLLGLAIFVGVPAEPPADPSDSSYIPRPEWYFLFLFEMLKYFPGQIEWVGTFIIPTVAVLALLLLPFYDRSPFRHWKKRKFATVLMGIVVVGMIVLTIMAAVSTPPHEETVLATTITDKIILGQDVYSVQCVECHGADGEGGEIVGVEGLEGVVLKPINSQDEMYTRSDQTLYDIIDYGQPDPLCAIPGMTGQRFQKRLPRLVPFRNSDLMKFRPTKFTWNRSSNGTVFPATDLERRIIII
jgi:hypothetical protein